MLTCTIVIEQHQAYLYLQQRISMAISNHDERLLMHLIQASQELFFQVEDHRKEFIKTVESQSPNRPCLKSDLARLVQVMEEVQRQVQENEMALQAWLDQMNSDLQHHRMCQAPRGVLASYAQQRQEASDPITSCDPSLSPSEYVPVDPTSTPSSPWTVYSQNLDTMGHQVNHQS